MRTLVILDDMNYPAGLRVCRRYSVRAVIMCDGLVAMLRSGREGFFKFPGGGIENGENELDTLRRETREEAGLVIRKGSETELGLVIEKRKSHFQNAVFEQYSYYYFADALPGLVQPQPEQHEIDMEFSLVWVDPRDAQEVDLYYADHHPQSRFLYREAYVLGYLADHHL